KAIVPRIDVVVMDRDADSLAQATKARLSQRPVEQAEYLTDVRAPSQMRRRRERPLLNPIVASPMRREGKRPVQRPITRDAEPIGPPLVGRERLRFGRQPPSIEPEGKSDELCSAQQDQWLSTFSTRVRIAARGTVRSR